MIVVANTREVALESPQTLTVGDVLSQRFEILERMAHGGMGTIYRAMDRYGGRIVALKTILADNRGSRDKERFLREIGALARLQHPGIVAYVAHGEAPGEVLYLAMEWLEGEDLAAPLKRGPLTIDASLTLLTRAAEALRVAHEAGLVHRDVKPSNIFLRGGQVDKLALVDFGIVRELAEQTCLTAIGAVIGTPEYMAPEQARGDPQIGPAADIFSLGAVVYHALTGRPPFTGRHVAACLAKLLFDEVVPPGVLRPEIPEALDALLVRMLGKDPGDRPKDAAALLHELAQLDAASLLASSTSSSTSASTSSSMRAQPKGILTDHETWMVSVVVAGSGGTIDPRLPTIQASVTPPTSSGRSELRAALLRRGAQVEWLAEGSLVVALPPAQSAVDQLGAAARCGLLIKSARPELTVAMAIGRASVSSHGAVGEAIDRAVALIRRRDLRAQERGEVDGVWFDDESASLLESRFEFVRSAEGVLLRAERATVDASRPLLGKPTPCVGRALQLSMLESTLEECVTEPVARTVRVVSSPGIGKSRLLHEFLRRTGKERPDVRVIFCRGEGVGGGSPHGLLGQALRQRCGIRPGQAPAEQEFALRDALGTILPDGSPSLVEFIGELCNVPFTSDVGAELQAARRDPALMHRQVARAGVEWLRAECARAPLLLVLEDLQWGDALTVKLVDQALRELADRPFMVLALGRPELEELFPEMWASRGMIDIRLPALGKRACEQIVAQALGDAVDPEVRRRIVERAGGNALFLEELIRASASGHADDLPESVIAMVQSRLLGLSAQARRLLRAASVFGEAFWRDGAAELLGGESAGDLDGDLEVLIDAELIQPQSTSRYPSQREYRFCHALMRDAAHSMLTEEDRALGHRLAAAFLVRVGEDDSMVLAEHARRGGNLEQAARLYGSAALRCYERNDNTAAVARAELGIACEAAGEALGVLQALLGQLRLLGGRPADAYPLVAQGLELLPTGSLRWYKAFGTMSVVSTVLGRWDVLGRTIPVFLSTSPDPTAAAAYIEAAATLVVMLTAQNRRSPVEILLRSMASVCATIPDDLLSDTWLRHSRAYYLNTLGHDPQLALRLAERACPGFARAGDQRSQVYAEVVRGIAYRELAMVVAAAQTLRGAVDLAKRLGEPFLVLYASVYFAYFLIDEGAIDEADAVIASVVAAAARIPVLADHAPLLRGKLHFAKGELALAEQALRTAVNASAALTRLSAQVSLIAALLALGEPGEARVVAEAAAPAVGLLGGAIVPRAWMMIARARRADGDGDGATAALSTAVAEIERRCAAIEGGEAQATYLGGHALADIIEQARAQGLRTPGSAT